MCYTVTPGGGPNLRVGEVLPATVPPAAKGELTDSDRTGEVTDCSDIFTAEVLHRITPVSTCFLDPRGTQLWPSLDRGRYRCLQSKTCGQVLCTPTLLPHPKNTRKNLRSQKLTLGRLQNCVFRQLFLNPSKNWLSTSQTSSLVRCCLLVTFTVHSNRAFTFAL